MRLGGGAGRALSSAAPVQSMSVRNPAYHPRPARYRIRRDFMLEALGAKGGFIDFVAVADGDLRLYLRRLPTSGEMPRDMVLVHNCDEPTVDPFDVSPILSLTRYRRFDVSRRGSNRLPPLAASQRARAGGQQNSAGTIA